MGDNISRSTLHLDPSKWPSGKFARYEDNAEYSCQTTSNCLHNETTNCLGDSSSTKLSIQFPPRNITVSQQVENFSSLSSVISAPLILTISIYFHKKRKKIRMILLNNLRSLSWWSSVPSRLSTVCRMVFPNQLTGRSRAQFKL